MDRIIQRLRDETESLEDRHRDLCSFIGTTAFSELSVAHVLLLRQQEKQMRALRVTLRARLALLEAENPAP